MPLLDLAASAFTVFAVVMGKEYTNYLTLLVLRGQISSTPASQYIVLYAVLTQLVGAISSILLKLLFLHKSL